MNLQMLINMLERLKPGCEILITADTILADLGMSSLDMIIMVCEIERIHGLKPQLNALKDVKTVGDLYNAIIK